MTQTYPKLYKLDSKKKMRVWYCEVDGGKFRIYDGLEEGKIKASGWTQCKAKNLGKVNATTPEDQAILEVKALYTKKLKADYWEDRDDASNGCRYFEPMLAEKYKNFPLWSPVFIQPKLDGIRAIAKADGFWSREGEKFATTAHLERELEEFFRKNPDAILDGELYNHDLKEDFNELSSLIRKQKPDEERLAEIQAMVQYHVYDYPYAAGVFSDRWAMLEADLIETASIKRVVTVRLEGKPEDAKVLDDLYEQWLDEKYEGQMVRLDKPYEAGTRSDFLLKRKVLQDAEFEVVALEEGKGNWAGHAKRLILKLPDGRTQEAGVAGTKKYTKALLEGPLPKTATVQFLNYTPAGKLRGPVAKAFYGDEGKI